MPAFDTPISAPARQSDNLNAAVFGNADSKDGCFGVLGHANFAKGEGVKGQADSAPLGVGVHGQANGGALTNRNDLAIGVWGESSSGIGVAGFSTSNDGVWGQTSNTNQSGVTGFTTEPTAAGITGINQGKGLAGDFQGNVRISGHLSKTSGGFKIDHPLDPANKYLYHSFVESPDMKNVYDGVVALDDKGEAVINLPNWFGALNKDFRYQLTAIRAPGPNLYIAEEISDTITTTNYGRSSDSSNNNDNNGHFKIAGGASGMKVSWQVTGIRKDPWANANPIQIEKDKPDEDRGYYLHPDLYGKPQEKMINYSIISRKVNRPEVAELPPPKMRTS